VPDPGPYRTPPQDFDANPSNFISGAVLASDLVTNPNCNVLFCEGKFPSQGWTQDGQEIIRYLGGLAAP
jgi:hypothetical protein